MSVIKSLQDVLVQYNRLCAYCNEFFEKIKQRYPKSIVCTSGCSTCCQLESVLPLEAHYIRSALSNQRQLINTLDVPSTASVCPFLQDNKCSIYSVRPLICRTHGLLLYNPETNQIDCCPENFRANDLEVDHDDLLDIQHITEQLVRLNLSYAVVTDQSQRADERILLRTIKEELLATD